MATVLAGEDDSELREMMFQWLEMLGYRVRVPKHGAEAMDALRAGLIPRVLDLMMPVMDGWKFRLKNSGTHNFATLQWSSRPPCRKA